MERKDTISVALSTGVLIVEENYSFEAFEALAIRAYGLRKREHNSGP